MAKSTTTTKAKTKTAKKKPAAKVTKKTTKSSVAARTKTTSTAQAVVKPVKTGPRFAAFHKGQLFVAGLFAALAVAAGFLVNSTSAQVFLGHLTKDELASRAGTVLAPAAHVLYDIEFRWLLVALLVTSALFALLRATYLKAQEDAGLRAGVQKWRWIDFAITNALALEIVLLLNGVQDAVALKLSLVLVILSAFLAWSFERENAATGKPTRSTFVASVVAGSLPHLVLLGTIISTVVYGMVRSPWYAYAAFAAVVIGFKLTVLNQWYSYKRRPNFRDYFTVDRNYTVISTATKAALAVILIVGLYNR